MASVIPKSIKSTLAPNLAASIELTMLPTSLLPSLVVQEYNKLSSDLRTIGVLGIFTMMLIRLLVNLHVPLLPSLNEIATGTLGSLVIVAQPTSPKTIKTKARVCFIIGYKPGRTTNKTINAIKEKKIISKIFVS